MTGNPAIDAILDRAHRYYRECARHNGSPPDRFFVSERDYALLRSFPDLYVGDPQHPDTMQLYGMKIIKPARIAWNGTNPCMEHISLTYTILRPLSRDDPIDRTDRIVEYCRTLLPTAPQPEIACPCGEVIWDLGTAVWQHIPLLYTSRLDLIGGRETVSVVDSEKSTLNEWIAGIDALIAEVRGHRV